jgi:hypothetical protein
MKADFSSTIALPADQAPDGVCEECARVALHYAPLQLDLIYCEHRLRGAWRVRQKPWRAVPGIERYLFVQAMARAVVKAQLTDEVKIGLTRLLEAQARDATKH